jgi:hypothetical protein
MTKIEDTTDTSPSEGVGAWALLAPFLPYADPRRRRQARKLARRLVDPMPWPGDDATPAQVAGLALLRLLWLQREAHRCSRRQVEASALVARASIETCITGLYWLHCPEDIGRARSQNAKSFRRMMSPLADGDPIGPGLIDDVAATIGTGPEPPHLRAMAELVAERSGRVVTLDLYLRLYVPLSTCVAHPTGIALLRHVDRDQASVERPGPIWTRHAAVHAADACLGILALEIAERSGRPSPMLSDYADVHMRRTPAPMATILGRAVLSGLRRSDLIATLRRMADLLRYYRSGRAARDPFEERKSRSARALAAILGDLSGEDLPAAELIVEHFAEDLARSVET